jgi:hypothetical protein
MMMERRNATAATEDTLPTPLPIDYLRMMKEVFNTNFDSGLKLFSKFKKNPHFEIRGAIFPNEVVLSVSLLGEGKLSANTVHGSCNFNPKKGPKTEELLSACVDVIGDVFAGFLMMEDEKKLEQLAYETLSGMENVPYDWTKIEREKIFVYIKMDKSNPYLDQMTDEWLKKNDPDSAKKIKIREQNRQDRFMTGEQAKARALGKAAEIEESDLDPEEDS